MEPEIILFLALLFVVALLYASVGHGGASGYLALMVLFSFAPNLMKPTALMLNLFVSSVSFIQFYRGGYFKWKIFWPFALASIPLSFVGGLLPIEDDSYKKILGLLLLVPILRFFFFKNNDPDDVKPAATGLSLFFGGVIGFLSGLIGIGGGIILSPLLLFLKWTNQKQAAAISALFIFVNSLAGLTGQLTKGLQLNIFMLVYVAVAFVGGLCGAYLGSFKFSERGIKYLLACVLAVAAYKLLFTAA